MRAIDLPLAVTLARELRRGGQTPASHRRRIDARGGGAARPAPRSRRGGRRPRPRTLVGGRHRAPRRRRPGVRRRRRSDGTQRAPDTSPTGGRTATRGAHAAGDPCGVAAKGHQPIVVVCGAWHVPALDLDGDRRRRRPVPSASVDAATLRGLAKAKVARRLGAVDPSAAHRPVRLRRRRGQPRLVPPRVRASGPRRRRPVLRRRGPARARPWRGRVARRADRRHPPRRVARRDARTGRVSGWPRCSTPPTRSRVDSTSSAASWSSATPSVRSPTRRRRCRWPATSPGSRSPPASRSTAAAAHRRSRPAHPDRATQVAPAPPARRTRCRLGCRRSRVGDRPARSGRPGRCVGPGAVDPPDRTGGLRHHPRSRSDGATRRASGRRVRRARTRRRGRTGALRRTPARRRTELCSDSRGSRRPIPTSGGSSTCCRRSPQRCATATSAVPTPTSLRHVVDGIVVRILAGLRAAARSLDDDAAALMSERLSAFQGALAVLDHPARHDGLPAVLVALATGAGHGLVQGRATRLLHDAGVWSADTVQRRMSQALSGGTPPARGAAFVEGFLAGSGSVLVHDADLLGVLDGWVASLPQEAFEAIIVLMRRTFGAFEAAERRQLMAVLMGRRCRTPGRVRRRRRPRTCRSCARHGAPPARAPGRRRRSQHARRSGGGAVSMQVSETERRRRWRLLLGPAADDATDAATGDAAVTAG